MNSTKSLYYSMETTAHFVAQWFEARTRFSNQLKTKAEALGRIVSHTAYHAGQMAIINKYGK